MKNSTIILTAFAVLLLGFLLTGCITPRRATNYFNAHAFQAASYCAAAFPVKSSTVYLPGKTIVKRHTDTIPGKTIPCPPQEPGKPPASVKCPPSIQAHDTVTTHDTLRIYLENTAKTTALQAIVGRQRSDSIKTASTVERLKNGRDGWRGKALWTWGIILVLGGGYVFLKSRTALLTGIINRLKSKI